MILLATSAVACLAAGPALDPRADALLRAAIVAGRATVVLASQQTRQEPTDLRRTWCDGPGFVVVVGADIAPPWGRSLLHFPAGFTRTERPYPRLLLRHAHSRYGLYVPRYHSLIPLEHIVDLAGASLPRLEFAQKVMTRFPKRSDQWQSLEFDSSNAPSLTPLAAGSLLPPEVLPAPGQPIAPPGPVYYDFLVTAAAECELFAATPAGVVQCHVRSVLPSRQDPEKPWDNPYSVPAGVTGPFAVVPHGKSRYLVTPAGALVKICADGKPLAKAAVVYDKSPVRAVVHDADEDKRYAFTATHVFEVAEPVVLKPHAVARFDATTGAAGLEAAFHCARAVRGLPPAAFPAPAK